MSTGQGNALCKLKSIYFFNYIFINIFSGNSRLSLGDFDGLTKFNGREFK